MQRHTRVLALIMVLAMCIGLMAGCAKPTGTATPAPSEAATTQAADAATTAPAATDGTGASTTKTDYRTLYSGEVTTMNYLVTGNTNDLAVCANVVDCLVEYDKYGVVKPALAESWSVSADGLTWTFKIRPGVSWVDSTGKQVAEVTAEDWVSSAKYVLDAANDSSTEYMFEGIVKNAAEYYSRSATILAAKQAVKDGKYATVEDYYKGEKIDPVEPMDFAEVGVKAVDKYTLQYTVEKPTPYFVSVLSYAGYFPVYGPFLEQSADAFGTDKDHLLFNGAYILSDFQPQVKRVLTKNATYWDKDNVFIEKIEQTYNAEASSLAPEMFKRGELDYAAIGSDILDDWLNTPETKDLVTGSRVDNSYSYFYAFNFDPQFDAQYEPDNWKLAVNNENFRLSIQAGLDRVMALSVSEPYEPKLLLNNTITPANFASTASGKDYVTFPDLASFTNGDTFSADKASQYKAAAMQELTAAGAKFPIKVLLPFNPATTDWDKECQVVEQQLEGLLGADYIDVVVEAGPSTGFLGAVRRSGKYALLKCNWGADFADPETWAQPFADDNNYNFMYKSQDAKTSATVKEYYSLVDAAKAIVDNDDNRYAAFAKAEASLIAHAIVIPYSVDSAGYRASLLNQFESQYAPYGLATQRYKGQHIMGKPMSMDEFSKAYETWKTERAAALLAASK